MEEIEKKQKKEPNQTKQEIKITNLKPIKIQTLKLKISGLTPYMPEPMDMAVLEVYNRKKSNQTFDKDILSEEQKAEAKYYFTEDGKKGIPARAFYNAMIRASSYLFEKRDGGMRNVIEGVTVMGDILPLAFKKEERITHWGRTAGKSRAPRKIIRNAFYEWSTTLTIQFNSEQLSAEQIVNIINWAGFHIGVGAFRKEKKGNCGLFSVVS